MDISVINTVNRKELKHEILLDAGKEFYKKFSNNERLPRYGSIDSLEFLSFIEGFVEARRARMSDFGYTDEFINKAKNVSSHDIGMIANSFKNSKSIIGVMSIVMIRTEKNQTQTRRAMFEGLEYAKNHFDYYDTKGLNSVDPVNQLNSIW